MSAPTEPESPEEPPESLAGTVVKGVGLAGSGFALTQLITFATYLVLARLVTPSDFGEFAAATVVVGVGTLVAESGMLAALCSTAETLEEAMNSAFIATSRAVWCSPCSLSSALRWSGALHNHHITEVAAVMSGTMLLRLATVVPDSWLQRRFSFFRRVIVDPLGAAAFAAGTIIPAVTGMGVWRSYRHVCTDGYQRAGVVGARQLASRPRLATVKMSAQTGTLRPPRRGSSR